MVLENFFRRLLEPQFEALIKQEVARAARQLDPENPLFNKRQATRYLSQLSYLELRLRK